MIWLTRMSPLHGLRFSRTVLCVPLLLRYSGPGRGSVGGGMWKALPVR
jgi:hypothetical protein